MLIKHLDRPGLVHENGLDAQRLLPWPELNAPFEGSWCVIAPGTASTPHAHPEYEVFFAVSGSALRESVGVRVPCEPGDIVPFTPGTGHRVVNDSDADFQMYSVWWDLEMTERFSARHAEAAK